MIQHLHIETCIELQRAGFPQKDIEFQYCSKDNQNWELSNRSAGYSWEDYPAYGCYRHHVACPTAEELMSTFRVGACVNRFTDMNYMASHGLSRIDLPGGVKGITASIALASMYILLNPVKQNIEEAQ